MSGSFLMVMASLYMCQATPAVRSRLVVLSELLSRCHKVLQSSSLSLLFMIGMNPSAGLTIKRCARSVKTQPTRI